MSTGERKLESKTVLTLAFMVLALLAIGWAWREVYLAKETVAIREQTQIVKACQSKETIALSQTGWSKLKLAKAVRSSQMEVVTGILADTEEDEEFTKMNFLNKDKSKNLDLGQKIIFVNLDSERLRPLLGRKVIVKGNFSGSQGNFYYVNESAITLLRCNGNDIRVPVGLVAWLNYLADHVAELSNKKDREFVLDTAYLIADIGDHVYLEYSDYSSRQPGEKVEDRRMLVKLGDFSKKELEVVADVRLGEQGDMYGETEKDIYANRKLVAELVRDKEGSWQAIR